MKATKSHKEAKPSIRFSAELEGQKSKSSITLPKAISAKIASQNATTIEGTVNGFPFREALQADNKGSVYFKINKLAQSTLRANSGESVTVEILRVGNEPEVRVPKEFRLTLASAQKAQRLWVDITPIARRDWIFWICTAKQAETRLHRIKTACSKLSSGMRRVCCFPGIKWIMKNGKLGGKRKS